ncbi:hypothetical protein GJ496_005067 [Pomphorhynchus laevis]|nr:hypothetical protein GJ496_005067 [Pomphorhynchus laevis]
MAISVQYGWPNYCNSGKPFWFRRNELLYEYGILMWKQHFVIPDNSKKCVLRILLVSSPSEFCRPRNEIHEIAGDLGSKMWTVLTLCNALMIPVARWGIPYEIVTDNALCLELRLGNLVHLDNYDLTYSFPAICVLFKGGRGNKFVFWCKNDLSKWHIFKGSRLCSSIVHDNCTILALTTMTVSLTESLDNFRIWFGKTLEISVPNGGVRHRRLLAKLRVLMIAILVAVLLKTSIVTQSTTRNDSSTVIMVAVNSVVDNIVQKVQSNNRESLNDKTSYGKGYELTAREFTALVITLLIAIHLIAREIGLFGFTASYHRQRKTSVVIRDFTNCHNDNRILNTGKEKNQKEHHDIKASKIYDSIQDAVDGKVSIRTLENKLLDPLDKVKLRTQYLRMKLPDKYQTFDIFNSDLSKDVEMFYKSVEGRCCENVVGFVPIPLGYVGPLKVNNVEYMIPMASTEGALLASTSRGCKVLTLSSPSGVHVHVVSDQMTRGPVFGTDSLSTSVMLREFIESPQGIAKIRIAFEVTSKYAKLCSVNVSIGPSTHVFVRFSASTGDAMGMNMVSKATEAAIHCILTEMNIVLQKSPSSFVCLISLSGNFCIDKKASSSNWLNGRGKSVVAEAIVSEDLIRKHFKMKNPDDLIKLNISKNFVGSAVSASQPGASCNAQAANIVAAIFAACGQDLGQVGTSSACMTWIERHSEDSLSISVTMPCIEVGTVGGGTNLPVQSACLEQLGLKGCSPNGCASGTNSKTLACVIAAAVMAAEISLLAALCTNDLVKAHMDLNRSK